MPSAVQNSVIDREPASPARLDFLDLKAQFASIREEVISAVTAVLEAQRFILGDEVRLFEEEVAPLLQVRYAVGCASGTDALVLSLLAAGVRHGDEVITTPFSFVATAGSIAHVGARPVFVDIDAGTFNIDPALIEAAVTPRTRAIIPVHLFGSPADMDPILSLAERFNLVVIEDAAQAIGATYKGRSIGSLGAFGCFSFFPSKNLGGAGDGGLVTTMDPNRADHLRLLRVHGSRKKYHHEILGTNSRLDALQAAILRVKLKHLGEWTLGRRARAQRYEALFAHFGLTDVVTLPGVPSPSFYHVYNQFTIRSSKRDRLQEFLKRAGVPSEVYYPLPLHLQPSFSYLGYQRGQLPVAEQAGAEVLSLPVFPELQDAQQEIIVRTIADFYSAHS